MDLVANNPADTTEKIRQLAERLGGFVVKSVTNGQNVQTAFLAVCVPAERFEEARAEIWKLGVRVDSERVEAQDVTRRYVDLDARLRNLNGEEAQYLSIMKRANSVKEMLEVSEKVSNVRGQIEQQQAEFQALSQQVETVAINISLHTEAEAQVFGLHWRFVSTKDRYARRPEQLGELCFRHGRIHVLAAHNPVVADDYFVGCDGRLADLALGKPDLLRLASACPDPLRR